MSLKPLIESLELFRLLDPELPSQTIMTFLVVAESHPTPLTMPELTERLGITQSSVSRNVALLSTVNRQKKPGHHLLETGHDPRDVRRKMVRLSQKGLRLKAALEGLISQAREQHQRTH